MENIICQYFATGRPCPRDSCQFRHSLSPTNSGNKQAGRKPFAMNTSDDTKRNVVTGSVPVEEFSQLSISTETSARKPFRIAKEAEEPVKSGAETPTAKGRIISLTAPSTRSPARPQIPHSNNNSVSTPKAGDGSAHRRRSQRRRRASRNVADFSPDDAYDDAAADQQPTDTTPHRVVTEYKIEEQSNTTPHRQVAEYSIGRDAHREVTAYIDKDRSSTNHHRNTAARKDGNEHTERDAEYTRDITPRRANRDNRDRLSEHRRDTTPHRDGYEHGDRDLVHRRDNSPRGSHRNIESDYRWEIVAPKGSSDCKDIYRSNQYRQQTGDVGKGNSTPRRKPQALGYNVQHHSSNQTDSHTKQREDYYYQSDFCIDDAHRRQGSDYGNRKDTTRNQYSAHSSSRGAWTPTLNRWESSPVNSYTKPDVTYRDSLCVRSNANTPQTTNLASTAVSQPQTPINHSNERKDHRDHHDYHHHRNHHRDQHNHREYRRHSWNPRTNDDTISSTPTSTREHLSRDFDNMDNNGKDNSKGSPHRHHHHRHRSLVPLYCGGGNCCGVSIVYDVGSNAQSLYLPEKCSQNHKVGRRGGAPLIIVCAHCRIRLDDEEQILATLQKYRCSSCGQRIHGGVSNDYGIVIH